MFRVVLVLTALLAAPLTATAGVIGYDFEWNGGNGYTMTGTFTFDEADGLDGEINAGELVSLIFEGFLNGTSFAQNSSAPSQPGFIFNFNTVTGLFYMGGISQKYVGQRWVEEGRGVGFVAGGSTSALTIDGNCCEGAAPNPVPPTASTSQAPVPSVLNQVPVPATIFLFGFGLAGLGIIRQKSIVKA